MIEVFFLLFIFIVSHMAGKNDEDFMWYIKESPYTHRLKIMNELGSTDDGGVEV